jgi:cellulose synthase/poly-beta-1,6-N-acetylglucosamine synthase-like glycosyltransferase
MRGLKAFVSWVKAGQNGVVRSFTEIAVLLILCGLILSLSCNTSFAQDKNKVKEAGKLFKPILNIIFGWVFPLVAAIAILYGVAKGIRDGEWSTSIVIILFGIGCAFAKPLIMGLFQMNL